MVADDPAVTVDGEIVTVDWDGEIATEAKVIEELLFETFNSAGFEFEIVTV